MDFTVKLKPAAPGEVLLEEARASSSLPVQKLSTYLLGDNYLSRQDEMLKILQADPIFSKAKQLNLGRVDRFKLILHRAKALRRLSVKHGWSVEDDNLAYYLVDDVSPYFLQYGMFRTTVLEQGSAEQRKKWLPPIENWEIYGCYGQSELGHGSNVRGIETTAHYDLEKQDFIIHSPTLTASKWWNGALGKISSHAIVMAQLHVPEGSGFKNCGVLPFIVQIRDQKTRLPLPGVVVGDIGPKVGYIGMDNGYLLFDKFRVPHEALLSRYSNVDIKTGKFAPSANPAVAYGSMTFVRTSIVMQARLILARAVTIAVRYTSVRRQFLNRDSSETVQKASNEVAVIDYSTVRIRIFPLLAATYALHYSGKLTAALYRKSRKNIEERDDFSLLPELHLVTSGLKSYCTDLTANAIETCRRAMGGHGFSASSGYTVLSNDYLSRPTVEGDNYMITQQVAQGLLKFAKLVKAGKKLGSTMTEANLEAYSAHDKPTYRIDSDDDIIKAFARRAAALTFKAHEAREVQKKPWNTLLVQFHQLSRAHTQYVLVYNFHKGIDQGGEIGRVLRLLFRLFAFNIIANEQIEFLTTGGLTLTDLESLGDKVLDLMDQIKPHAVRLVDAWAVPDFLLDSALGRYDGKVYEDLFNRAHRLNPLNDIIVNPDFRDDEVELGTGDGKLFRSKM